VKRTRWTLVLLFLGLGWLISSAQMQIVGLVKVSQAGLEIRREGTEAWVTVSAESIIGMGDVLRTSGTGQAEIALLDRNTLIQLRPNTELAINRLERNEQGYVTAFGLLRGGLRLELRPIPDTYVTYEFTTPSTTLLTAGGIFELWADDDQSSSVLVSDGLVYVGAQRLELRAAQGLRASLGGVLSEVQQASSAEQLRAGIEGVTAQFRSEGDIQLNVRRGPSSRSELLGTIFPNQIERVMGISQDGNWYRIRQGQGYGWVSQGSLRVSVDRRALATYPADHQEAPGGAQVAAAAPTPAPAPPAAQPGSAILQQFTRDELALIARLNEWRISTGTWPLKPNSTLRDMARAQAQYLISLPSLPDDLHADAKGRGPRQRALDPAFQWPHYATSERVAIGENAYVGASLDRAIGYWQNSQIHREAATNPGYREVGVAIVPHPLGSLYVVVFGARPNVLPALLDPASGTLYISAESYRFAAPGDWVNSVNGVQFIPSLLSAVDPNAWQPWAIRANRPADSFVVAYRGDANKLIMTNFNAQEDIAWLPSNLPSADQAAQAGATIPLQVPQLGQAATTLPASRPIDLFMTNTPSPGG
jgi:uncharacterized protein YkwD